MIAHIEKSGINFSIREDIKTYSDSKIGRLDHFLPRHARKVVHAELRMREYSHKANGKKYECEAIVHLPCQQIAAIESAQTIIAAIDLVEEKLKAQLQKYKSLHVGSRHVHPRGVLKFFSRQSNASQSIT